MSATKVNPSMTSGEIEAEVRGFVGPLADRMAILDLNALYADTITRRDLGEFGKLWTPDAIWVHPTAGTSQGPHDIVAMCERALQNFPMVLFRSSLGGLRVQGARARAHVYADEVVTDSKGKIYRAYGLYYDEYAKETSRWLFQNRKYKLLFND